MDPHHLAVESQRRECPERTGRSSASHDAETAGVKGWENALGFDDWKFSCDLGDSFLAL